MFRGPMAFPPKPPAPPPMTFELDEVDLDVVIAPIPSASPKPDAKVVVVVEDDVATRELLIRGLGTVYTVYAAGDGRAALELLERMAPPDVIVCDVMMPHMDGVTFARAIKQDNAYRHVPIILLTAKDSPTAMIEGINAGARHYLTKPFKIREVLDRIEALVKKVRR
jgi:DNA-binding response OmpR family regulator